MNIEQRLRTLCAKLLTEVRLLTPDRANSNLPEWDREAMALGVDLDDLSFRIHLASSEAELTKILPDFKNVGHIPEMFLDGVLPQLTQIQVLIQEHPEMRTELRNATNSWLAYSASKNLYVVYFDIDKDRCKVLGTFRGDVQTSTTN